MTTLKPGAKYFPFLKIKRDMDRVLLNMILGHPGDVEFLLQKLNFLEKLTKEYDSIGFTERLEHIVDNAEEMLVNNLLYGTYKHIGELVINYKFNLDDLYEEMGISNHDVIQKYNIVAPNGANTVYDSILSKFDFENITDSDIENLKIEIIEDFNLHQKYFSNTSVFEFKNDEELAKHIKFCESYLNYHLLNDTQYIVEIYETDDVYEDEDDEESSYDGKPMYEGKLINKNTEEELENSTSGRYCEISSVFEELLDYINNEILLNQTQETEDIAKEDVIKNDIIHNIFCLDEEYGIVVPTFKELVAAGEILPEWQLSEEYGDYPFDSIVNIINERYSDFLETLYTLDSFNENEKKKKKYGYRTYVEYGTPLEIIEVLQELHDWNDDVEDKDKFILLQASVKKEDFSTIQVLLGIEIGYAKLEAYLKDELDEEFHDEVVKLIEAIKEAKADKHETLHLYDC